MHHLFSLKKYILSSFLFFCINVQADTLGPTTLITSVGGNLGGSPFSCFNTKTNQFFVGWRTDSLYCSFYSPTGTLLRGPTIVVTQDDPVTTYVGPVSCYNSTNNKFLISYYGAFDGQVCALFNILDQNGISIVGPTKLNNLNSKDANSLIFCCYNSTDNEYALTWSDKNDVCLFAIVDAQGNIKKQTSTIAGSSIGDGNNVFVSYNATENQYFFTWQGNNNFPYFAIYNADGTVHTAATAIPSNNTIYAAIVPNSYNNSTNQYVITWRDNNNYGFFTLYDVAEASFTTPTQFTTQAANNGNPGILSSYNTRNNDYFLSWDNAQTTNQCVIIDALGTVSTTSTDIDNVDQVTSFGFITNSYGISKNTFFISWVGNDNKGYYAIYTQTPPVINPPTQGTGQHLLNRFFNYGEYFNALKWRQSTTANITHYNIYRTNTLIATVPSFQTTYEDHNQPTAPVVYSVTTIDKYGVESAPLYIQI